MPARYQLTLSAAQVAELTRLVRTARDPYVRERASAIFKVAEGESIRQVALHGCLRGRKPQTVGEWIRRYLEQGETGLHVLPGRGRPRVFSPSGPGGSRRRDRGAVAHVAA